MLAKIDGVVGTAALPKSIVDLVYFDGPFSEQAHHNEQYGAEEAALDAGARSDETRLASRFETFARAVEVRSPELADYLRTIHRVLRAGRRSTFLAQFALQALELRRVMKTSASLFVHCDPTVAHQFRQILEIVFGAGNFRSEIVWPTVAAGVNPRGLRRGHDLLLWFTASEEFVWEPPTRHQDSITAKGHDIQWIDGVPYRFADLSAPSGTTGAARSFGGEWITPPQGREWVLSQEAIDEQFARGLIVRARGGKGRPRRLTPLSSVAVTDVWDDIGVLNSAAKERVGYPTQKPSALLERVIRAASREGDLVFDPMVGSGTTAVVAQRLGRRWIAMDISGKAVEVAAKRVRQENRRANDVQVVDGESAQEVWSVLTQRPPTEFAPWLLAQLGYPVNRELRLQPEVDLVIHFEELPGSPPREVAVEVATGKPKVEHLRKLESAVTARGADIGVLVLERPPTKPMRDIASHWGEYTSVHGERFPRLQMITVEDLLAGERILYPDRQPPQRLSR